MLLLFISILIGLSIGMIGYLVIGYIQALQIEKRLKTTLPSVSLQAHKKSLTETILFAAEKVGKYIEHQEVKQILPLKEKIEINVAILGNSYGKIKPYTYIGAGILCGVGAAVFLAFLFEIYNPVAIFAILVLGFFAPSMLLSEKVKKKHSEIFRQIPDALDLLCLMMEAGLDFNSALNKLIENEKGALIDEFFTIGQEIKLGKPRIEAFNDMAERVKYAPLSSIVNSLILGFKTGGSLAPTLKILSAQFRIERMQLAEKKANEAPLKLMLPLVLFIFPTVFIVLFGPIILAFITGGGF
jgi:tight adherence protein C